MMGLCRGYLKGVVGVVGGENVEITLAVIFMVVLLCPIW